MKKVTVSSYARTLNVTESYIYKQIREKKLEIEEENSIKYVLVEDDFLMYEDMQLILRNAELQIQNMNQKIKDDYRTITEKNDIISRVERENADLRKDKEDLKEMILKLTQRSEEQNILQAQVQKLLQEATQKKRGFLFWKK